MGYLNIGVAAQSSNDPARLNTTRDTLDIALAQLHFNQTLLPLPASAQTWIEVLGQPTETRDREDRYTHKKSTHYVWSQYGVKLYCEYAHREYSTHCSSFTIALRPSQYDKGEVPIFSGQLTLEQLKINSDTRIPEFRRQLSSSGRFLFGSNGSYFYNVCQPAYKRVYVDSVPDRDSPQYKKLTNISIGLRTADDKNPCKEALSTPYQSVTEAMAFGLFEQAKLYVNEKGECDRACVEKRTAAYKQLLNSVDERAKESADPEEKSTMQQFQSLINRLKRMDEAEQEKQKSQ